MRASTGFSEHFKTDRQTVAPLQSTLEWCSNMTRYVKRSASFGLPAQDRPCPTSRTLATATRIMIGSSLERVLLII